MKLFITQLIVIGTFCDLISCSGYFTVVGSKLLRKNAKYSVAITSRNFEENDIPTLEVGIQNINSTWKRAQNITLINGKIQTLEFDLTGQPLDDYKLRVTSIKGINFSDAVELDMNTKNVSVFVQTDKGIYKANDTVQFRALVLNENLKPLDGKCLVQIHITDGNGNRVKQFDDVILVKGVFQGDLKLSDWPVLGDWHIHVIVDNNEEAEKVFKVTEYTLPYLKVSLNVNPHAYYDEQKIRATLVAEYTFGGMAEGTATINAEVDNQLVKPPKEIKVKNGKKFVEFDMENYLIMRNKSKESNVKLRASFTEQLTDLTLETTVNVKVHKAPYQLQIITNSKKFKPGLPFTIRAIVLYHDKNVPVTDSKNSVIFTPTFYYLYPFDTECELFIGSPPLPSKQLAFLSNGISEIEIQIPDNVLKLEVSVKYLETEKSTTYFVTQSENDEYIKIKTRSKKPKLTENIQINVQSTKEINEISYHVLSTKRAVVASGTIEMLSAKSKDFEFTTTHDMVPKARIVVFYITTNGEIISDSLEFEVEKEFRNFIDIKTPKSCASPNELIDISITSNANSFIGLLGVDQSVLALNGGNDIEWSAITGDLQQYNKISRKYKAYDKDYFEKIYSDFQSNDVVIITNAKNEHEPNECDDPLYTTRIMGSSEFGVTSGVGDEIAVRKMFPETWIFDSFSFKFNQTNAIISKKVPDTISSWIITGFSIDPITGLGLTKQPTKLSVLQPFFVSIILPYSIKRGEIISIPIFVSNYMESDQTVNVTLYNEDSAFKFIADNEGEAIESRGTKNIDVKSQSENSTWFIIQPIEVGQIKIKIVATSPLAGDGVERYLNVEPEGVTEYAHQAVLINLINGEEFKTEINIDIPSSIVPDSIKIVTSVTGDILGTSVENEIKSRKLQPHSAEQTMINFVRNIVVLDYLTAVNKLSPEIKEKAKTHLETGYRNLLQYKREDGSYKILDRTDIPGSTWLTAFVARTFREAAKYIVINPQLIEKGLEFLSQAQSEDGSFAKVDYGITLTAYTLITFLENPDFVETYKSTINKTLAFFNEHYESITDNYSLAILAYVLQLANHPLRNATLTKLEARATSEDGMIYWRKKSSASNENSSFKVRSQDIEMTAYALQAFLEAGRLTESLKIMKWLVSQKNENGGFISTHDTVIGLQALSKVAIKMYVPNSNIDITVEHDNNEPSTLQINERKSLILQKYELPSTVKHFEITAKGHGLTIFQLYYQYNIHSSKHKDRFIINPIVDTSSTHDFLNLRVCTSFIPDEITAKSKAVMIVTFPSGFVFHTCSKPVHHDVEKNETFVAVYIPDLNITGVCLEYIALRVVGVSISMQKPAPVYIYDYNDPSRKTLEEYNLPP